MKLINEQAIFEEWAPQIEAKTGVSEKTKLSWLTKYCHFHALNESSFTGAPVWPNASLQNTPGMGNVATGNIAGGVSTFYGAGAQGSGDKFPSLLPLAIQVGARTVGFDIVPVIPMNGPSGVLAYLDYVYTGGKNSSNPVDSNQENPALIKVNLPYNFTVGKVYDISNTDSPVKTLQVIYVGKSRIDGFRIFRVLKSAEQYRQWFLPSTNTVDTAHAWASSGSTAGVKIADVFGITDNGYTIDPDGTPSGVSAYNTSPSLVKAFEDHIQGYAGAGAGDEQPWFGNFISGLLNPEPMRRGIGEQTAYRTMGLQAFTKFVEAETFQVAATVTQEQISDLNRQFGIDVVGMVENSLVNEVSQHINKHILSRAYALGWSNHSEFYNIEGQCLNMTAVPGAAAIGSVNAVGKDGSTVSIDVPTFVDYSGGGVAAYENQWTIQRRVLSKILAAGNVISQRGRRGQANVIVCNLQIATILQDSAQFTFAPMANTINQNNGALYPLGAVAGMTVFVDPNMEWSDTRVLVARKGADEEPGLKYMPYLMAESAKTIAEGTMAPKIAIKSRYALVEAGQNPQTQYFTFYVYTGGVSIV
jgi:hypothetical protein